MLKETLLASLLAGFCAAVVLTCLQCVWVTPLILQGEVYEDAAAAHETSQAAPSEGHHHEADEWKPSDGMERTLYTAADGLEPAQVGGGGQRGATNLLGRQRRARGGQRLEANDAAVAGRRLQRLGLGGSLQPG